MKEGVAKQAGIVIEAYRYESKTVWWHKILIFLSVWIEFECNWFNGGIQAMSNSSPVLVFI